MQITKREFIKTLSLTPLVLAVGDGDLKPLINEPGEFLRFEDYDVKVSAPALTTNLLIPFENGFCTNPRNEYAQFITDVILIPKDLKRLDEIKKACFESEMFVLTELTSKHYENFRIGVINSIEKNFDKFNSIRVIPERVKTSC